MTGYKSFSFLYACSSWFKAAGLAALLSIRLFADPTPPTGCVIVSPQSETWMGSNFFLHGYGIDNDSFISNINIFTNNFPGGFYQIGFITNNTASNTNYFTNYINISAFSEGTNWFVFSLSNINFIAGSNFSNYFLFDKNTPEPPSVLND
ncbi:MAG TPA: hypothetical protein DC049_10980, partial [Spirochaetia bacterium]|nr:hypothetical protein [Spirochaetia bacterium]